MAILSSDDLAKLIRENAKKMPNINYVKADITGALQAIENWFDDPAVKSALSSAIDTGSNPFVFTASQKKWLVKFWLRNRFGRE